MREIWYPEGSQSISLRTSWSQSQTGAFTPCRPDGNYRLPRRKRQCKWRQVCTDNKNCRDEQNSEGKKKTKTVAQIWRWASTMKNSTSAKEGKGHRPQLHTRVLPISRPSFFFYVYLLGNLQTLSTSSAGSLFHSFIRFTIIITLSGENWLLLAQSLSGHRNEETTKGKAFF